MVGTRPQFVKLAPLCRAVEQRNRLNPAQAIDHQIIHTGQHYDREVADLFFDQMRIPVPKFNLGVGSGSHGTQLARMLARMEPILCSLKPQWVVVYGDTNSTFAGALLAARLKLPLAHVEAGCRSGKISQPEEQNRIVADHLSQLLLPASERGREILNREGIGLMDDPFNRRISVVGDILLDALLQNSRLAEQDAEMHLKETGLESKSYYLLTLHRAENTDDVERLRRILEALSASDAPVLFPVHPRTSNILTREGISLNGNLRLTNPQGYLEMLAFEKHALKIITDSGGVQKEAFYLGVPCITLRDCTEWVETVEAKANRLVEPKPELIQEALSEKREFCWKDFRPYGDGNTAQRIVTELSAGVH